MAIATPGNMKCICLLFASVTIAPKRHHDDAPDAIKKAKLEVVIVTKHFSQHILLLIN